MSEPKFDPVKEFINLRDSISKAVGQSIKNVAGITPDFPALDVYETDEYVVVRTEPILGINISSVEVSMEEDILTLKGLTKPDLDVADEAYLQREIRFGEFAREVRISRSVKSEEAKASIKHGVLTIKLPKKPNDSAGQIISVTPAE